ncbi:metallophosphoesterase family protein [Methylocystis sp.]|uniref:metallophosphoesterase family protein n=1 Tax=Methylocystis sp. TaxID=1911079 RepID=UPI003DA32D90
MSVRWLHISDVHECLREEFHREGMYNAIVEEVRRRLEKPDLVFFTGDLAFAGTASEYELLQRRFLTPLQAALPDGCPIFTVPGNHDVNRKRAGNPRSWMTDIDQQQAFQQVDADGRQKRVDMILPRFESYRAIEKSVGAWGDDWLASEMGAICAVREISGRRLAIVGINTAWLCHDEKDWGHLTAGKTMVEAALKKAHQASPDLTIVLGHHPLAAMMGEEEWSDGERIRMRLEQANAVYLHGHMHRSGTQRAGDSMQSVLAIQAPSGFQGGDSSIWRNGIMWGEANFDTGRLIVEPKRWNDDHREYVFDSDTAASNYRVKGRDAFAYLLPGRLPASEVPFPWPLEPPVESPPEGWQIIDAAQLADLTATRPTAKQMSDWFDGSFPRWEVATAEGVHPRQVVDNLVRWFEAAHHAAPRSLVRLLTGAGGEGKSAALLQTVAALLRGGQSWSCLWRQSSIGELPAEWPKLMPRKDGHAWIVAIDDAENVGRKLPDVLRGLGARTDVHLILAAREADWTLRGLQDGMWHGVADYRRVQIAGLDEMDARRVADGWAAWGDEAMGKLRGQTPERAAKVLLDNARELAANREEGALLGALLITREGEALRERVIRLMTPWQVAEGVGGRLLLDIYAMIAAMHAENQLYLSRTVLAYALECEEVDLEHGPLRTLRREAMVDGGTTYILTRHRKIAEVARDWLVDSGYNVDQWFPFLARAALLDFLKRRPRNSDINSWQWDLTKYFLDSGPSRWPVARAIAKALFTTDPDDPFLLTGYARTLRETEQPGLALALMREHAPNFAGRRDILLEWSVAAGAAGDSGLSIWLAGRSLADDRNEPFKPNNIKLSLAGLGLAFGALAADTGKHKFSVAQAACGRLGMRLGGLDTRTRSYFERYASAAPGAAGIPSSLERDIATLSCSVGEASYEAEPDNSHGLDALIGEPDSYHYKMLTAALSDKNRSRHNDRG